MKDDLVYRLRKRAEIRRQITTRKSVQNNEPDRIADLLDEAAATITELQDFAIWMTGCGYDFTQHEYFIKCRDKLLVNK